MTNHELTQLLMRPEYDFLREDEHLKGRIIFLTLGGSHAYGTNVATSDVDIRGCALNSPSDLLGMTNFEQKIDTATDTTIYSFNKLIPLLLNCNPNTIELLGCKTEHYVMVTAIGRQMLENRKMFLSQRAARSFGGYATQQLRRLENALAHDRLPQEKTEEHILNSMRRSLEILEKTQGIELFLGNSEDENRTKEIFTNISLKHYPIRSFHSLLNELGNIVGTYDKLNHRNHKKDEAHLNKHAMHLIRLFLTVIDLFEKGDIITYRGDDKELLMSIRNGAFMNADGTYRSEFFDLISEYEKRMDYAKKNTSLPESPDTKRVEEFVMEVNRMSIQERK